MKKYPFKAAVGLARSLRRNMTDAEQRLWRMLRFSPVDGYKFRRQVPFGNYIADFACHEARLIIELDGGQHDLSSEREIKRTGFLEVQGYRVLRFWNNEVLENTDGVLEMIMDALLQKQPPVILSNRDR